MIIIMLTLMIDFITVSVGELMGITFVYYSIRNRTVTYNLFKEYI